MTARLPRTAYLCLLVLTAPLAASPASAQIQASERALVAQTIDGTTLTIDYSRPAARGRELFGGVVPWNVVWTPGANWATTLEVDRDIRLNGVDVPAGQYSVWAIPRPDRFTVTLNPEPKIFHFLKPDSTADQIHLSATPERVPHVEILTWSFPLVRGDGARLQMAWGTTAVPLDVVVQPTKPIRLSAEERARYVGRYDMSFMPGVGWPESGTLEVFEQDGALRARLPFTLHPDDEVEWDLVPAGGTRFNPGLYRGDRLFSVEMGINVDFEGEGERMEHVRFLGPQGGLVLAEGGRIR